MFYKEYYCSNKLLISKIKNKLHDLDLTVNITNKIIHTNDNFYDEELFFWLNECIGKVCSEQYTSDIKLVITECWVTHTQKFQKHHLHSHHNSIVSGIFYLDNSGGSTDFYLPNVWSKADEIFSISKSNTTKTSILPEPGKLILFPSHIKHETGLNNTFQTRNTLVFNTFFKGTIGKSTTRLDLNVTSVEDRVKNNK
jgi:hypothetical protein